MGDTRLVAPKILLTLMLLASQTGLACAEQRPDDGSLHVAVGYLANTFADVGYEDARAATRIITDGFLAEFAPEVEVEHVIFQSVQEVEEALRHDELDLVGLSAYYYFAELRLPQPLEPAFVIATAEDPFDEVVLVVQEGPTTVGLESLRGRSLRVFNDADSALRLAWLDTVLMRGGLEPTAQFFAKVIMVSTSTQTLLPVFFGQADACLVTRRAFLLASELNPQVGERLTVLLSSPPLGGGVLAFRPGYPDADKVRLIALVNEFFKDDVTSQQLMTLFGRRKLMPFKPEYTESVKSLVREHAELVGRSGRTSR